MRKGSFILGSAVDSQVKGNLVILTDKVALVTGAGRGIGEAVALSLAKKGANLVIASRTEAELEHVASEVEKNGRQVEIVIADVSEKKRCKSPYKKKLGNIWSN